jgi:polar amino acid transport system substrate-binding protein
MRRHAVIGLFAAGALVLAACGGDDSADDTTTTSAAADTSAPDNGDASGTGNDCTAGKTLTEGKFTAATGEPAYPPYVIDDDPASGQGFEAAVIAAVAAELGYSPENVVWTRADFTESIAPGAKNFDVNIQQYSITAERAEVVTFSAPYYSSNQAIVALAGSAAEGAASIDDLKALKFGAQIGTTSLQFIDDVIAPDAETLVYDDNAAAKAALEAGQIDAVVVDLPTAFYIAAVEFDNADVIAQFPASAGGTTDDFGMLLEKDNPLAECVDAALESLRSSGALDAITQEWMSDVADAPVISVG